MNTPPPEASQTSKPWWRHWPSVKPMILAGSLVGGIGGVIMLALTPATAPPAPAVDVSPLAQSILNLERDTQQLRAELAQRAAQPPVGAERLTQLEQKLQRLQEQQHLPARQNWLLLEALWQRAYTGQPYDDLLPHAAGLFPPEALPILQASAARGLMTTTTILHAALTGTIPSAAPETIDTFFGTLITLTRTPKTPAVAHNPALTEALLSGDAARITTALAGTPWQLPWHQRMAVLEHIRTVQQSYTP